MSFARNIAKSMGTGSKPRTNAANMLGFVLASAEETLIADMSQMIRNNKKHSLEGYVFCLSRVVSHNEAWLCICEAFRACNAPIPEKYYALFGQIKNASASKSMKAQ